MTALVDTTAGCTATCGCRSPTAATCAAPTACPRTSPLAARRRAAHHRRAAAAARGRGRRSASTGCGSPAASRCCAPTSSTWSPASRLARAAALSPDDQRAAARRAGAAAARAGLRARQRQPRHPGPRALPRADPPGPARRRAGGHRGGAGAPGSTPVKVNTVLMRGVNDDEAVRAVGVGAGRGRGCGSSSRCPSTPAAPGTARAMVTADEILAALAAALRPDPAAGRGSRPGRGVRRRRRPRHGGRHRQRDAAVLRGVRPDAAHRRRAAAQLPVRARRARPARGAARPGARGGGMREEVGAGWPAWSPASSAATGSTSRRSCRRPGRCPPSAADHREQRHVCAGQYAEAEGAEGGDGPGEERAGSSPPDREAPPNARAIRRWNGADPAPEAEAAATRGAQRGAWSGRSTDQREMRATSSLRDEGTALPPGERRQRHRGVSPARPRRSRSLGRAATSSTRYEQRGSTAARPGAATTSRSSTSPSVPASTSSVGTPAAARAAAKRWTCTRVGSGTAPP